MMEEKSKDKFKAVWVSHSSIGDFLRCPRFYYLKNIYRDPLSGHKMSLITPPLALGQAVHEVIESLSGLPVAERLANPLVEKYEAAWQKVSGEKGGFKNPEQEAEYKDRGTKMLQRIEANPGPLLNKAVKIPTEDGLPYYWLSEENNIILCGKIDWIEFLEPDDAIHIIDFKTGKVEEDESSLQLPIYLLLAANTQKRKVNKASYWYLNRDNGLVENDLPQIEEALDKVHKVAKRIKLARQINHFICPQNGCRDCLPMEKVTKGEGRLVGTSQYGQDLYILD